MGNKLFDRDKLKQKKYYFGRKGNSTCILPHYQTKGRPIPDGQKPQQVPAPQYVAVQQEASHCDVMK